MPHGAGVVGALEDLERSWFGDACERIFRGSRAEASAIVLTTDRAARRPTETTTP